MNGLFKREVARCFLPLLQPARYKGAHGGRGSGKSHFFAEQIIEDSLYHRGLLSVCIREVQRSLKQSSKRLIESKIIELGVGHSFHVFEEKIETPGDGIIIFNGMQDHTAESIKSLESFNRGWWEEAQNASATSLRLLRPTFFRVPNCELFFSWNPRDKPDPEHPEASVDGLLRGPHPPPGTIVVESQFEDNPWFPPGLREEEEYDRSRLRPEEYAHTWRGGYLTRGEARVFHNWSVREFETPANALFHFGGDFGFSVDPSVLMRCFVGRWDDEGRAVADPTGRVLFIDREAYRVGCDVDHTPALFAGNCPFPDTDPRHWKNPYGDEGIPGAMLAAIVADSARPETISYLKRHGFSKIEAAIKGKGSVEEGIEFLKAYDIVVHPSCKHAADEFTYYSFKTDPRTGLVLPVLEDKKNHVINSCRYAVEKIRRRRPGFFS